MTPNASVANLLQQGHDQLDRGEYQAGSQTFHSSAVLEPQNPQVLYGLGLACYRLEQYQESVEYLNQALETKPNYILALAWRGLAYQAWYNRGNALGNLGRFEDAIASYDKAIEFKHDLHAALINQGNPLVKLGQNTEAIKSYNRALKSIDPQWWEAWNKNRGLPNIYTQDNKPAVKTWDNGINTLHTPTPDDQEGGRELNPEKWEKLQDYIMQQPSLFPNLSQAKESYEEALEFLILDKFPEEHLQVLQKLLKVYSRVDTEKFKTTLEEGTQQL